MTSFSTELKSKDVIPSVSSLFAVSFPSISKKSSQALNVLSKTPGVVIAEAETVRETSEKGLLQRLG